jgi:signal peptide peptidase SppA
MTGRYEHVLSFALAHPWAVMPEMRSVIASILARRVAGVEVERAEIEAALVNRKNLPQPRAGSVAIIPVYGVIAPRMNLLSEFSGGTTFEKLTGQLRAAMGDKAIKTIVLDVDSPGGSVAGNAEFAAEVMRARVKKPIIAVAQYTMGSAAYHLAAAATEVVAAPSARVGSIGVFYLHEDLSEALKAMGVKSTYISAGEGKVDGNPTEPLSDTARARMTALVDEAYSQFVGNVVKGRGQGMTAERVRKDWKALVYGSAEALSLGLIDAIETLDETLERVLSTSPDAADQRAARALSDPTPTVDPLLQEPAKATSPDWQSQLALERQLFELQLTTSRQTHGTPP